MSEPIHIESQVGKIAYEAWASEFHDVPYDDWSDLNPTTQEAWEDIFHTIIENRIILPKDGVEISFRTQSGSIVYAFTGIPDGAMKDEIISTLWLHMTGQEQ